MYSKNYALSKITPYKAKQYANIQTTVRDNTLYNNQQHKPPFFRQQPITIAEC